MHKEENVMSITINDRTFPTFDDYLGEISETERQEILFSASVIGEMVKAHQERGLSQQDLADLCGMKQPAIARIETLKSTPKTNTLINILAPLGLTLKIMPTEEETSAGKDTQVLS